MREVTPFLKSYHICGKTLHSTLQLPIKPTAQRDLQGPSVQHLQHTMRNKHYLIVDEMSMMGQKMLVWVDRRLHQATAKLDEPLGGISVILFGDFAQLPPVCDLPLYSAPNQNPLSIHGYTIYKTFSTVVILNIVLRQAGTDTSVCQFRDLLLRLRDGDTSYDDWQTLLHRSPPYADNFEDFREVVHLFYDRKSVAQFNFERLALLGTPIATVKAIHSSSAAAATKSEDAGGLSPIVFLAKGARVMLTANLWAEVGLCNGAAGTVHDLIYIDGQAPPNLPVAVFNLMPTQGLLFTITVYLLCLLHMNGLMELNSYHANNCHLHSAMLKAKAKH